MSETAKSNGVCGARCDHGSECLLPASPSHDRHETQHGCVFYALRRDPRSAGAHSLLAEGPLGEIEALKRGGNGG